jgi:Tfp pilus assembly protein PilV
MKHRLNFAKGYVLFEVILALTVFSLAVLGMAKALGVAIESVGSLNRENDIRVGLRSFVEEIRRKETSEMVVSNKDDHLDATFSSTLEPLDLRDRNGSVLNDLYTLHAVATYSVGSEQREETVDVYVYKPQKKK